MKYREITGKDGSFSVSSLAIGTAVKMTDMPEKELFTLFDIFFDAGGNCIDTARAYGGGRCEEKVGSYLLQRRNREKLILSTKGCHPGEDGASRLTYADMKADLDKSLQALHTDYVDVWWIHKDDESYPVEQVVEDANRLMREGSIRALGVSNWHTDRIAAANAYAKKTGQTGFALSQIQWSLADSTEEKFKQFSAVLMDAPSYDWYLENQVTIFSFSPQAHGFFSKVAAGGADAMNEMFRYCYGSPENMIRLERVKALAAEKKVPVSVPVLAYLIDNKLPCIPVFGATRKEMLYETLQAVDFAMTPEEADDLFRV